MMQQHIAKHQMMLRQEQTQAGGSPITLGQTSGTPPMPGQESGADISGQMGSMQAGSPVPAEPAALPEAAM